MAPHFKAKNVRLKIISIFHFNFKGICLLCHPFHGPWPSREFISKCTKVRLNHHDWKYSSLFGLFNSCQVHYVLPINVFASKISFNVLNIQLCESVLKSMPCHRKIYVILTSSSFITSKFLCSSYISKIQISPNIIYSIVNFHSIPFDILVLHIYL